MSEQNNKWLFLLLPFALSKLMEWSHTNAPDNLIYKSLICCQYGVILFFILAVGYHFGVWANESKDRTWFKLRDDYMMENRQINYKFKEEYVPLKEEISLLSTQLREAENRARYFQRQFEEALNHSRRTPEDANKAALASVAEV